VAVFVSMDRVDSGVLTDDILANQAFQGSAAVEDDGFRGRGFMLKARFELDDYVLAVWRQDVVVAVFNEKKFSEFECSVGVPDSMLPILPLSLRVYCLKVWGTFPAMPPGSGPGRAAQGSWRPLRSTGRTSKPLR